MPLAPRVLVVDHVEPRGRANSASFSHHVADTFAYDGNSWTQGGGSDDVDTPSKSFDLVLLHDRDSAIWHSLEGLGFQAKCLLRYTGGTPGKEEDWIAARPIIGKDSAVTVSEALEIVDWAEKGCLRTVRDLPSLLRRHQECLLPALAILCQGYLAVYAREVGDISDETVADALRSMGWIWEKHAGLVKEERWAVTRAEWWTETFGLFNKTVGTGKQEVAPTNWALFRAALNGEWGSSPFPASFDALLGTLERFESVESPLVVAGTYLAIAKRLGRPRNNE